MYKKKKKKGIVGFEYILTNPNFMELICFPTISLPGKHIRVPQGTVGFPVLNVPGHLILETGE